MTVTTLAVLPATPTVAGPVQQGEATAGAAAPYCPDHPDVPLFGRFLVTRVVGDQHIDVYRVPDRYGFRIVSVYCD